MINNKVWGCGNKVKNVSCALIEARGGIASSVVDFGWKRIVGIIKMDEENRVIMSGVNTYNSGTVASDIADCQIDQTVLTCKVKSFYDTLATAVTYVPFPKRFVQFGMYNLIAAASVLDQTGTVRSYLFTALQLKSFAVLHAQSVPSFIGTFIAGTAVSTSAAQNYIIAGMMRTDSGIMTAMYLTPVSDAILNSAELVNAMALEYEHPDMFITGGLELSNGVGLHAYLLRVNALLGVVKFGMMYHASKVEARRNLLQGNTMNSITRDMERVENALYMIVNLFSNQNINDDGLSVLKVDSETGLILMQVHLSSPNASLSCSDIAASMNGLFLYVACQIARSTGVNESLVLSVDSALEFLKLPHGFSKTDTIGFSAQSVPFRKTSLTVTTQTAQSFVIDSEFSTHISGPTVRPTQSPTAKPSLKPSSAPSGQPSSCPTAAPSVSPQPTSQPSSSGPTNTYKPTIKPSLRPIAHPTAAPSSSPSGKPSHRPTLRPTDLPSVYPSVLPSVSFTASPTCVPTARPTRLLTELFSRQPSPAPSALPLVDNGKRKNSDMALVIGGSIASGLLALWFLNWMRKWLVHALDQREKKKVLRIMLSSSRLAADPTQQRIVIETIQRRCDLTTRNLRAPPTQVVSSSVHDRTLPVITEVPPLNTIGTSSPHLSVLNAASSPLDAARPVPEEALCCVMGAYINSTSSNLEPDEVIPSRPPSLRSSSSSSIVLSSLHTSERSDVVHSVPPDEASVYHLHNNTDNTPVTDHTVNAVEKSEAVGSDECSFEWDSSENSLDGGGSDVSSESCDSSGESDGSSWISYDEMNLS